VALGFILSLRRLAPSHDGLTMQREDGFRQGFCKKVGWLINRSNGLWVNGSSCNVRPQMIIFDVNVLSSRPHCGSPCQSQGSTVVFEEGALQREHRLDGVKFVSPHHLDEMHDRNDSAQRLA
jgi:hypothetical protein